MRILALWTLFMLLNFGALALGSWLMAGGSTSTWYANLNKAPWTPPGWLFGVAWTTIMVAFSMYMARRLAVADALPMTTLGIYAVILVLCIIWNIVFFAQHQQFAGLLILLALTLTLIIFTMINQPIMQAWSWLLVPFIIWSILATSLNAYTWIAN